MTDHLQLNGDGEPIVPRPPETKREAFTRICEARVDKAIEKIRRIGMLSNRQLYDYSEEDIDKVVAALHAVVEETSQRFRGGFKL